MEVIKNGFKNERLGVELDVYVIEGKEWFKDSDIANFLEYRDSYNMKRVIDFLSENSIPRITRNGYEAHYINEFALYEAVLKIRNSETDDTKKKRYTKAREFQQWVFSEVLPSLRKTNSYVDEKYITDSQREELVKDQARKLDNYSSVFEQSAQNRNLKKFLEYMFKGRITDPFAQFIDYMKICKTLDCDNVPTEKFRELNKKHDYFKWQLEVDHEDKWKIEVKPNGMKHLLDTLGEENGKLIFRKRGD